ncbi:hypothetical protein [Salinicoccus carnicancri]|uniref:hypothetical protein n=1 Tax=Salinicoccus carnicancri TaxID=558170 RepID=UPI00031FCB39|nr:hypothetical protein [Salinicoccus carnicancri]
MKFSDETYKKLISEIMAQQHGTGKVFNFLVKLDQFETEFTVDKPPEVTLDKIREITVPIDHHDLPDDEYLFYIGTGIKDLNPAVVHLKITGDDDSTTVSVISSAAEGLIRQKSNKKAIEKLKMQLGLLDVL